MNRYLDEPNFINLHNVNLEALLSFELKQNSSRDHSALDRFDDIFRECVTKANPGYYIGQLMGGDVWGIGNNAKKNLIVYSIKQVTEMAIKCDSNGENKIEVDIQKDIWTSTEAQNVLSECKFLKIYPNTNTGILDRLTSVVMFIFSIAGCKISHTDIEDNYKLQMSWTDGSIFRPKCEIASRFKNQFPHFNEMRKNKEFVDCIVEVEGQNIPAHRCILSGRSLVFKTMFTQSKKEDLEKICFPYEKLRVINLFLDYLYQGFVIIDDITLEEILALTRLAKKYQIVDMFDACRCQLKKQITLENVIKIYVFAEEIDSKEIREDCARYCSSIPIYKRAEPNAFSLIENLEYLKKLYPIAKKLGLTHLTISIENMLKDKVSVHSDI